MFSALLDALDSHHLELHSNLSPAQHKKLIDEILPWLSIESEPLIESAKALLGETIFGSSELGLEYSSTKSDQDDFISIPISIGSMYIRPEKNNRDISISLLALRGFTNRLQAQSSSVEIELEICDARTKEIFESMYKDYRGQINEIM